jgi:hypothetical protein
MGIKPARRHGCAVFLKVARTGMAARLAEFLKYYNITSFMLTITEAHFRRPAVTGT